MTNPSRLHDRVRLAFAAARPERRRLRERRGKTAFGPPSLYGAGDAAAICATGLAHEHAPAGNVAIAGAGLLSSAFILGTGLEQGLGALAAGVAAAGIVGAIALLRRRKPAASGRKDLAERQGDRRWERLETRELLFGVHDQFGDIAMIRDHLGRILAANAVVRRLGDDKDPIGRTCDELGLLFEPAEGHEHYRVCAPGPDGMRVYDWHNILLRDAETGQLTMHSIGRDMTREERVMRVNEAARLSAEEANRAKSQLLATVSHDIRTPLSGILGMSNLLSQTRLTREQANYLAGMQQSGHALVQLVEDLLDFSSMEAGRFELRPGDHGLRELLESVVELMSSRAHDKGIEIASTVAVDIPAKLSFDAPRLRQVLFNVIGNAVKFTSAGGVFVSTVLEAGNVVIRVEDSGAGMTEAELARIFDEFEQAGAPDQKADGTGLGLSISRRIMTAFGGALTADSRPGCGSCFTIRFPLTPAREPVDDPRTGSLASTLALVLAPSGPVARALEGTITALGGTVVLAATLAEAEAAVAAIMATGSALTDVIVDHRHAPQFTRLLSLHPELAAPQLRKTYLLNPEERLAHPINQVDGYQAWLIRPLRERTLVDVLRGRMKGIETRDAINDNRPVLRDAANPAVAPEVAVPSPRAAGERSILLAEDDPVNAMLVRSVVEKAGFAVRVVGSFPAVTAALYDAAAPARLQPSLLITDVNMPGGDAVRLIETIRAQPDADAAALPILVLSADTSAGTRLALAAAGADAILAKPAAPAALLAEIKRLLSA
ncbi:Signal transduction histidine kinase [Rhizobium sp. RU20A]|uniref:hybrid sensor histidine kinase/response regulator n=1 Tax=Rhizobium sp. RU20A TaxID=1907412 RepID=UPI000955318C|nr:ATP-binding protein [Rhizobium sp. RU20A]SIQ70852.1 Signal transduction histidine kinase [Rhizobium sp. RU20A]